MTHSKFQNQNYNTIIMSCVIYTPTSCQLWSRRNLHAN